MDDGVDRARAARVEDHRHRLALRQRELLRQVPEAHGWCGPRHGRRRRPRSAGPASASRGSGGPRSARRSSLRSSSRQAGHAIRTTRPPASGTRLRVAQEGHGSSRCTGGGGAATARRPSRRPRSYRRRRSGSPSDLPRGVGALGDLLGAPPLAGVAEPVRVEGDQQEPPRGVDLLRGGLRGDFQRPVVVVAVAHPCRTA